MKLTKILLVMALLTSMCGCDTRTATAKKLDTFREEYKNDIFTSFRDDTIRFIEPSAEVPQTSMTASAGGKTDVLIYTGVQPYHTGPVIKVTLICTFDAATGILESTNHCAKDKTPVQCIAPV